MDKLITVWVTKYALTIGIQERLVEYSEDSDVVTTIGTYADHTGRQYFHKEGRDWHRTLEAAKLRAEEMRNKKIKSLGKELEKIKNLKF